MKPFIAILGATSERGEADLAAANMARLEAVAAELKEHDHALKETG